MRHTFLFEEAVWLASGCYIDDAGRVTEIEGEARVRHRKSLWTNQGKMVLLSDPPSEFENMYEILPFRAGRDHTHWTSRNPALGKLIGQFVIVEDVILSLYRTESGSHTGMEYMQKMDDGRYLNKGTLSQGDKKISSWSVELLRQ